LHVHPRDAAGRESLEQGDIAAALDAIRAQVPGVPVGVSTGWWIAPGGRARQAPIAAWRVLPDYVSVNLVEADAPEIIALAPRRRDAERARGRQAPAVGRHRREQRSADPRRARAGHRRGKIKTLRPLWSPSQGNPGDGPRVPPQSPPRSAGARWRDKMFPRH